MATQTMSPATLPVATAKASAPNMWVVAITVTIATFMELLDTSIANVALPHIGGGLGRSYDETTWVLTTYLVANAVVLPLSAWLSRVMGRKNYYLASVFLFTAMSFVCGIAPSLNIMLLARVFQGLAGGGLAPVAQAVLVDTFPAEKRASAFALYTVVLVTAPAIGPVLGGWITDNFNWRWIFFINVPIGVLSLLLSTKYVNDPPSFTAERKADRARGRLSVDGTGIALVAIASAALEIALDRGQIDDWFGSTFITGAIVIAVAGWIATVLWELRVENPVIDFRMLTNRNFSIASALFFLFGISLFGTTVLIPELLETSFGDIATDAGLVLAPGALAITILAPISAQLLQRRLVSPKLMLMTSVIIVSVAMWYLSGLTPESSNQNYLFGRVIQGTGYGFFFVPLSVVAYSTLKPEQNNRASSLTNLFRNWGGSFGVALITTMTARRQTYHQLQLGASLAPATQALQQSIAHVAGQLRVRGFSDADSASAAFGLVYHQLQSQALFLAFADCFRIIGWLTLVSVPLVLLVKKFAPSGEAPVGE